MQVQRLTHVRALALALIASLFIGCRGMRVDQHDWVMFRHRFIETVDTLNESGAPPLTVAQAEALLGKPDLVTNAETLYKVVNDAYSEKHDARHSEYRAMVTLFRVYKGFCHTTGQPDQVPSWPVTSRDNIWRDDPNFCGASIRLYEEAKHFEKALSPDYGYTAFMFFERDNRIAGAAHVIGWLELDPIPPVRP